MILFLGVLIIAAVAVVVIYNGLVVRRNRFKNAFAQIDVQLERRYDLVPNLVEVAQKYMSHERETLEAVVKARNAALTACQSAAGNPTDSLAMAKLSQAENVLSNSLGRLLMLTENYPDLKAQQTMNSLMEELGHTENLISFARQSYNDAVMNYNSSLEKFPANMFAGIFGFSEAVFLKVSSDDKRTAPKITMN
ncbi:MAG: hypothetical protein RLZZ488_1411 [Pseudomonadota bacterium]|jgi:LemA protein